MAYNRWRMAFLMPPRLYIARNSKKLASLTDSAPVDKVNFIKVYAKA
jgi:hypothetical protein